MILFGKHLTNAFWLWLCIAVAAIGGLIISLVKGWNIAAILFSIALVIAAIFATKELNKGGLQSDLKINSAQNFGDSLVVSGIAFAENRGDAGNVFINDKPCGKIKRWSDNRIVFLPDSLLHANDRVFIINGDGEKSNIVEIEK